MRYQFVSRETNNQKRYHVDKYVGMDDKGKPVSSFERQVPFRKKK